MKKIKTFRNLIQDSLSKIHLVDKCLIIIMFLLLMQSAYSIFFNSTITIDNNNIDIIVRTATASIFGYFLSSNFIRRIPSKPPKSISSDDLNIMETGNAEESEPLIPADSNNASDFQIVIATIIAIFCLIVLVLIRNIFGSSVNLSASTLSTISQFRDLVSGCIGFLIGVPSASKQ